MHESLFFFDQLTRDHQARFIADAAAHRRTRAAPSVLGSASGGPPERLGPARTALEANGVRPRSPTRCGGLRSASTSELGAPSTVRVAARRTPLAW